MFGIVQIVMFAGSAITDIPELRPSGRQWAGMGIAMGGLIW